MLDIVCFKWRPQLGYRSQFGPETVNTLRSMLARHYQKPHRLTCITDDPAGIHPDVRIIPLWNDHAELPSPHGGKNPACYRRLKLFSAEAKHVIGPRFVALDLDCVITADVSPIFDRTEDFLMYGNTNPRTPYNGSLLLMTAGARRQVWERFEPRTSPRQAMQARFYGSDQAWISYCLGPHEAKFTKRDGIYSFRNDLQRRRDLPADARIVVFHGKHDPWEESIQRQYPWVKAHYRLSPEPALERAS